MAMKLIKFPSLFSYQNLPTILLIFLIGLLAVTAEKQKRFYVVYLGDHELVQRDFAVEKHINLLTYVKGSDYEAKESLVYSYTKSFNAFAAKLSEDEAQKLMDMEEVFSVFPNRYHKLHTTKSWDFIGLPQTAKRNLKVESNMIVALFDTGITPESDSFKDHGFGPPPTKWKGSCGLFANFSGCNNKLIGAKYFKLDGNPDPADILSPVDVDGHGTHTDFKSRVELGNGKSVFGTGVSLFDPKQKLYPLVSGADVAKNSASKEGARFCIDDTLDPNKVKGKLVYCMLSSMWGADSVIKGIGGAGTIISSPRFLDASQIFMAPGTVVNDTVGNVITNYIQSTKSPSAVIHKSQEAKVPAPFIASFSSRGVSAYVKSFHPSWTPAAIKSAILTTAKPISRKLHNEAEFAYGAGQVNPHRAVNPGLVYDMNDMNYIQFLCHEGYSGLSLAPLVGSKSVNCSSLIPGLGYDALNYPTMQLSLKNEPTTAVFRRIVTNVGHPLSIYNATIRAPKGVEITVRPMILSFTPSLKKRSFTVVVKAKPSAMSSSQVLSGSLVWKSPRHSVRSPILIYSPLD
ncbi:hypothetical protein LWI28_004639 [Acer negundo]|uniref:Uncharacterized protein n=1 Tax=Acer negundo TaxID=4023 RepID=A0AAD5IXE4_ACENE|nr:hypothetical protein LWI28_004639 [Acer negundo]